MIGRATMRTGRTGVAHLLDVSGEGGDAKAALTLAAGQQARGRRVTLVTPETEHGDVLEASASDLGLELVVLDGPARNDDVPAHVRIRQTGRILRGLRPDVVHIQTGGLRARDTAIAAALLSGARKRVVTAHSGQSWSTYSQRDQYQRRWARASRLLDAVTVPSRVAAAWQLEAGLPERRVHVVRYAVTIDVDATPLSPSDPAVEPATDRPILLFAARLERHKGVFELLDAIADLRTRGVDCQLLVAGDGSERDAVRSHVDSLGLGDLVRLLGHRTDVGALLATSDLFVHPSHTESFGLSPIEAMMAAVPVITTEVGIVPELPDGVAHLVPVDSAGALADAIADCLSRDLTAQVTAGREAANRFTMDAVVDAYEVIYAGASR